MELRDALRGTGASRAFTDEPVDDATLRSILDDARFAPSGGNRQPWKVAIVRDATVRRELAQHMQPVWDEYVAGRSATTAPFAFGRPVDAAPVPTPNPLLDGIEQVPVVLVVAGDLNRIALMDANLGRPPITGGASIYPFCWSILLAARDRGLGGVMTTFMSRAEAGVAPLLGLPSDHALVATIFLGHPQHQNTRLRRLGVGEFTTYDRFDGEAFDG